MSERRRLSDGEITNLLRRRSAPPAPDELAATVLASLAEERSLHPIQTTGRSTRRPLVLLAAAALLLVGGALAAGSGVLRRQEVVPPVPAPSLAAVVAPSPDAPSPASPSATAVAPARLVFVRGNAVYVAAADGSGATRIASNTSGVSDIRWAPAGRRFAIWTGEHLVVFADDGRSLASYPFMWMDQQFAWSPDGNQIAMLHRHGPLEILGLDGTPTRTLPLPEDFGFTYDLPGIAWSPDGKTIALAGCTRCAPKALNNQLWLDRTDGSGLTELIHTPFHYTPSWGPDGKELYFGLGVPGSDPGGLAVIKPDGSGFRQLSSYKGWLGVIAPSPDGSRILALANPATAITVNADGGQPVIANGQQASRFLGWSPDGRVLTVDGSGVVEFDPDGGNRRILVPGAVAFDIGGSR